MFSQDDKFGTQVMLDLRRVLGITLAGINSTRPWDFFWTGRVGDEPCFGHPLYGCIVHIQNSLGGYWLYFGWSGIVLHRWCMVLLSIGAYVGLVSS